MEGFPNNLEPIRQFMLEAISQKCEGLMLKLLDSAEVATEAVKVEDGDDVLTAEEDESEEDELDVKEGEDVKDEEGAVKKKGRRKALLATYEPGEYLTKITSCTQMSNALILLRKTNESRAG